VKWVSFIPAISRRIVIRAAQLDSEPAYLSGESGSGKSAIARWIHQNSPRSTRPFVSYSRGDSLAERVAQAEEGTLVLLDVDAFTPEERAGLARLIRSRSLVDPERPGFRSIVRARIIACADRPIDEFSPFDPVIKDFRIHLPALREREADLPEIIQSLLEEMAHELRRDHVRELAPEALTLLRMHEWRGNLRELRNALRYGILRTKSARIEPTHLPALGSNELLRDRAGFAEVERAIAHSDL
jgi:DNA-binding NtrC family response regulator